MTKQSMGYPLPSGDAFEDELACMILFYPDRAEYRQALFGSLDYLATWIAWERDDERRGIDAGRAWALAILATRECIEMDACGMILGLLSEIRDNTALNCCDVVDISDGDRYTDAVEDEVGDVPQPIIDAGYADDAADWEGFFEYKCMVAHVMVDNMTAQLEQILSYMVPPSAILGGIPTLAAVATTIFIDALSVLVYSIALGASVSFRLNVALAFLGKTGLESLIDDMAEHHDALVCAIYDADGSDDAVASLKAEIVSLFTETRAEVLTNLNVDAQLKALYGGQYDEQDIAAILEAKGYDLGDFDCEPCGPETVEMYILPAPGGTVVDQTHIASISSGGCEICSQVRWRNIVGGAARTVTLSIWPVSPNCGLTKIYRVWNDSSVLIWESHTEPTDLAGAAYASIVTASGSPFTNLEVEWTRE